MAMPESRPQRAKIGFVRSLSARNRHRIESNVVHHGGVRRRRLRDVAQIDRRALAVRVGHECTVLVKCIEHGRRHAGEMQMRDLLWRKVEPEPRPEWCCLRCRGSVARLRGARRRGGDASRRAARRCECERMPNMSGAKLVEGNSATERACAGRRYPGPRPTRIADEIVDHGAVTDGKRTRTIRAWRCFIQLE